MKSILYNFLYYSGFNYIYSHFLNRRLFIVMYHSIGKEENKNELRNHLYNHISVGISDFEEQLKYLKRNGHTFILFKDLHGSNLWKIRKPTIIYFDDGFKDTLENAIPILKKYNIPATIFIVTSILDHTNILWTVLLKEALIKKGIDKVELSAIIEEIKIGTEQKRIEYMQKYPVKDYDYLFDIFLSWDEVRQLAFGGFEIGSHGMNHLRLIECNSDGLKDEINGSKKRIESKIEKEVEAFSLPYGRGNDEVVDELRKAGYKYVLSRGKGLNRLGDLKDGISYLSNISPKPGDSLKMFKLKMYALNLKR